MMIYSGGCGSGTVTSYTCINQMYPGISTVTANGLTIGNTYYLMIDGYGGDVCDYQVNANTGSGILLPVSLNTNAVTINNGASTTLTVSGGDGSYVWSPATGLNTTTGNTVTASPTTTTTYTVSSVSGNSLCPSASTDQVIVTIPPGNPTDFCDDFESGGFTAGNWTATSGVEASVSVGQNNPIGGNFSAEFTGGGITGWVGGSSGLSGTTSAQAWAATDHISSIEMTVDLSTIAAGSVAMQLDYNSIAQGPPTGGGNFSWFQVLVNGNVIPDINGNVDYYSPGLLTLEYDVSNFIGTSPVVTLQASCRSSGSDIVFIDNFCIVGGGCMDPTACNFDASATFDDGSCTPAITVSLDVIPNPACDGEDVILLLLQLGLQLILKHIQL